MVDVDRIERIVLNLLLHFQPFCDISLTTACFSEVSENKQRESLTRVMQETSSKCFLSDMEPEKRSSWNFWGACPKLKQHTSHFDSLEPLASRQTKEICDKL